MTSLTGRILVADDEESIRWVLQTTLAGEGHAVEQVETGDAALDALTRDHFDLALVDIKMPGLDGLALLSKVREAGLTTPIVIITAQNTMINAIEAMKRGAYDYVTKPFDIEEVVARLHALVRRSVPEPDSGPDPGLALDPSQHAARFDGRSQTLTPTEFRLLATLAGKPGKAISRRDLIRTAWPHGAIVHDNTLDVYIARIRRKLAALAGAPTIKTLHGVGYRLQ
jgi:two-component system OmpR family response regulator